MLLADKRDLQNSLKVSLLQIEEKELNFYTNNCMTVGTQAALLAGFAFAAVVEIRYDDVIVENQVLDAHQIVERDEDIMFAGQEKVALWKDVCMGHLLPA